MNSPPSAGSVFSAPGPPDAPATPKHREYLAQIAETRRTVRRIVAGLSDAFDGFGERVVEIGCGHGHFLTAFAGAHRDRGCVGVDFNCDRIRRAQRKLQRAQRENLHFIHAEAFDFLHVLPAGMQFSQVFVLFPDPWPKRRHQKHRLLSPRFLRLLAAACRSGCRLYFRSDSAAYAASVQDTIGVHADWRLAPQEAWPFEYTTVFQEKAPAFFSLTAIRNG